MRIIADAKLKDGRQLALVMEDRGIVGANYESVFQLLNGKQVVSVVSIEVAKASGDEMNYRYTEDMRFLDQQCDVDLDTMKMRI